MMKTASAVISSYVILISLFCLITYVESTNPRQTVGKDRGQVSAVEVVRARFGSGPDDIGIVTPKEAYPEGPMSFALGSGGEIYILDQINSRVQVFKNMKRIRTAPIPFSTFMDIDVTPDGKIVLLDNLVRKAVYVMESKGKVIHHLPLVGRNVPYAPEVTGIYTVHRGDLAGIWLDVGSRSVRISSLDGRASPDRISVQGKLTLDGKHLMRVEKIGDVTTII